MNPSILTPDSIKPCPLVTVATSMEAAPLLEKLCILSEAVTAQGRRVIRGLAGQAPFTMLITGPGMVNTAQALTGFLEHERPALVLQTGIAGIFPQTGLNVGDIAVATSERYIHTGVYLDDPVDNLNNPVTDSNNLKTISDSENDSTGPPIDNSKKAAENNLLKREWLAPLPFDLLENDKQTRTGLFLLDQTLAQQTSRFLNNIFSKKSPPAITHGPFITVSAITGTLTRANSLFNIFHPVMEAMEGAAAAQVCRLYQVPFMEIRGGSNLVGERDKTHWDIPTPLTRLSSAVVSILKKEIYHE